MSVLILIKFITVLILITWYLIFQHTMKYWHHFHSHIIHQSKTFRKGYPDVYSNSTTHCPVRVVLHCILIVQAYSSALNPNNCGNKIAPKVKVCENCHFCIIVTNESGTSLKYLHNFEHLHCKARPWNVIMQQNLSKFLICLDVHQKQKQQ